MIVEVDFKSSSVKRVFTKKATDYNLCRHPQMVLDEHLRQLSCEKCGKVIDPYEYVAFMANSENRLSVSVNLLKKEERALQEKIEALKREHKNLKARVNTASKAVKPVSKKKSSFNGFAEIKESLK